MGKVLIYESVTLDGVMEQPERWSPPYQDADIGKASGASMSESGALLFGRRTYEQFYAVWPNRPRPNPFTDILNDTTKFVASRTLTEPLPWQNSVLLKGDLGAAVKKLKQEQEKDIVVLGSGNLVTELLRQGLVDACMLLIHPITLGTGQRLFPEGLPRQTLELVNATTTGKGVIIATYRPV